MTSTNVLPILKTDTKGRVRTPAADREALLDLFDQGGMSGAAFARLHGIRYSTFAHWRNLRRKRLALARQGGKAPAAPAPFYQEVVLRPVTDQRQEGKGKEVRRGRIISLSYVETVRTMGGSSINCF